MATSKKELEKNITDKFMLAVTELGHDSAKLKREIKKAAKFITKKIERKEKAAKEAGRVTESKASRKAASVKIPGVKTEGKVLEHSPVPDAAKPAPKPRQTKAKVEVLASGAPAAKKTRTPKATKPDSPVA